ncbi:MAG: CaiB/BaiF CoA transferase family protein [Thermodesulfobacteriota bacterium]
MLPLQDLKILDLTRLIPGGYATLILADLGAEVLKIEDIELGDYSRWMEPTIGEYGVYFHALNRNKKSMKLNLKAEDGKKIFKKLVEKGYDTIVESFRPGVMDRLGIGYNTLREINPRVIYCAISGYGQNGPKKEKALHDLNCLAVSGALSITGEGAPAIPGIQIADTISALFSVISILTAYIARGKTSQGQFIDVSMTDGLISLLSIHLIKFLVDSKIPEGGKMDFNGQFPCYRIYKTKDGEYMTLAALEKKFWENFCTAIGRKDLIDKQYDDSIETRNEIEYIFKSKTRIEWEEISENIESCLEPVLNFKEVTKHPHLKSRNLFFYINHHNVKVPQVRIPFLMSDVNNTPRNPAPLWGEHTDEILISISYDEKEIESLKKRGVIG